MRLTALLLALLSPAAWAAEESAMNAADVSWMMVATTLVLFMTIPGIALFYAGMVRKKNVLSVVMQSFAICCSITIVWYVCGYSLAFTEGNFFIGGFDKVFLHGIGINTMQGSIPEMLFMMFQMTFAVLTPALMCGAFAERMNAFPTVSPGNFPHKTKTPALQCRTGERRVFWKNQSANSGVER